MNHLVILLAFVTFQWVDSESCPDKYKRFSLNHSFCLPKNASCQIHRSGVGEEDRKLILKTHNDYRSKVATGKEKLAGGLPLASNMMQMEWDDELAAIAQKWTENCNYEHDCNDCRASENFGVGQNLASQKYTCNGGNCLRNPPTWFSIIKMFYDEVSFYDKKNLNSYTFSTQYGHFSQVIWAETWRIGCGYVLFSTGTTYMHFFGCNYGPSGNFGNQAVYKEGNMCSACPLNSCCGDKCKGTSQTYPGLCKMLNTEVAPEYPRKTDDLFFNCDATPGNPFCTTKESGIPKWERKPSLQGAYYSAVLKGGETSRLFFEKTLEPKTNFCLRITFRKSPMLAGQPDKSTLTLNLEVGDSFTTSLQLKSTSNSMWVPFSVYLSWNMPTRFSLSFSVPDGASSHVLDIKDVIAFNGKCEDRKGAPNSVVISHHL